jgi:hypothetical protein
MEGKSKRRSFPINSGRTGVSLERRLRRRRRKKKERILKFK